MYTVQMKLWITGVSGHYTLRKNHNACCQVSVWNTFQPTEETYIDQHVRKAEHARMAFAAVADAALSIRYL